MSFNFYIMNIYIGNLSYRIQENDLKETFEQFGEVASAKIIKDQETGKSRGFAFVEMPSEDEGNEAISSLNNFELDGRKIVVNQARPRNNNRDNRRRKY